MNCNVTRNDMKCDIIHFTSQKVFNHHLFSTTNPVDGCFPTAYGRQTFSDSFDIYCLQL